MKIKKHKEKSRLIVFQGENILVLQKLANETQYGFIGGFLEPGESPETALIREAFEETGVRLSEEDLIYHCSVTIEQSEKQRLTKHYFFCRDPYKPFGLAEPHKFKSITWMHWQKVVKSLGKSDKKVAKQLFKLCNVDY